VLGRALSFLRADVPAALVTALGRDGADAYDLVDRLPRGPAREAAWNAYALQTYADKLVGAGRRAGFVRADTALYAKSVYALVSGWLERAHAGAGGTATLPRWSSGMHSAAQLAGMREALTALRTYVAFDLASRAAQPELEARLAEIDACIDRVDGLWIERPPAELRGGIAGALTGGLEQVYELGRILALGP
jgi:hypothetical protein